MSVKSRLLARGIRAPSGCLEWQGCRNSEGYGQIKVAGKQCKVHRVAYEVFVGPIPDGKIVMHSCDNTLCYAIEHLLIGTHKDNAVDRQNKGRGNQSVGELQGSAKLTWDIVAEIRALPLVVTKTSRRGTMYIGLEEIAAKYGVDRRSIRDILNNKTWQIRE